MAKSKNNEAINNSTSLEIVKIYFDEWKYRHENFWKRLTQFAIITFFTSSMPITYRVFGRLELPSISMLFFPICGIILAFVSCVFCLSEYKRLDAVGNTIKRIIDAHWGKSLDREELTQNKLGKIFRMKIGVWIPCALMVMQIVLASLIIWMIAINRI